MKCFLRWSVAAMMFAGVARAAGPFTVNTASDTHDANPGGGTGKDSNGNISLRSAMEEASTDGGSTTINLPAGTYNLSLGDLVAGTAANTTIYLHGTGTQANTTIHQTLNGYMVISINENVVANVVFIMDNVTVSGGSENENDPDGFGGSGGAILAGGSTDASGNVLSLTNVMFANNYCSPVEDVGTSGGAIDMTGGGNLNIFNCIFSNNVASKLSGSGPGGAIAFEPQFAAGSLSIHNSVFINNTAVGSEYGQGGAIYLDGGADNTYTIGSSTFSGNSSGAEGGAIYIATGNLTASYNRFAGNSGTTASGVYMVTGASDPTSADVRTNWWGANGGPAGTGANTVFPTSGVVGSPGNGQISFSPSLQLDASASPTMINVGNSATITAGFLTDSSGQTIPVGLLTALIGVPITWINAANGTVSGQQTTIQSSGTATATFTATTVGTGHLEAKVDNVQSGDSSATASITINQPPSITSANGTTFTVGTAGTFTVTDTGSPTPGLSESGALPNVVGFNPATGVLSGTPSAGTGGTYPLVITATNAAGTNTQSFTLIVNQAAAVTSANHATFTVGSSGTFTVTASGFPTPGLSVSGTTPTGVSFNSGSGVLSGIPAAGTGGTYSLVVTATNAAGTNLQSFTLTVDQAPAVTSANGTTFTVGNNGSFTMTASGFPAPNLSVAGALPGLVSFNSGSGVLSGIPNAGTGGTYPLVVTATNVAGTNTQSFTLTVDQPAAITSVNHASFTAGSTGSFTVTASGFPVPTLSESGSLPTGVGFTNANGVLAGVPGPGTGGTYPVTFTAHNGVGTDGTQGFTLTVNEAPSIDCPGDITTNSPGGVCLPAVSFAATAGGYPAPAISYQLGASTITSPTAFSLGTNLVNVTATNFVGTNTCSFNVIVQTSALPVITFKPLQFVFAYSYTNKHNHLVLVSNMVSAQMSWTANASCFLLQSTTNTLHNGWTTIPTGPSNTLNVPIDMAQLPVFYRLAAP